MKRSLCASLALLATAALVSATRPASVEAATVTPCTNPYTGNVYCTAADAVSGFNGHVDFYRRTSSQGGFLTLSMENCLISAAVNALNASSSSAAASQLTKLELQLLQILGSPVSPSGTPLLTLPIFGPPLTSDPTPLPVANCVNVPGQSPPCGPVLSNCFLRLRCPLSGPLACAGAFFATQCDACEAQRRLIARTLAFDLLCASQLAAGGAVQCGSNTVCTQCTP